MDGDELTDAAGAVAPALRAQTDHTPAGAGGTAPEPATLPRSTPGRGPPEWYGGSGDARSWVDGFVVPGDPQALPEPEYD